MRVIYCWRCRMDVSTLDDLEFGEVSEAMAKGAEAEQPRGQRTQGSQDQLTLENRLLLALEIYRRITGFEETNPRALFHHILSLYGPACRNCGKPLRTPRASWCAACG